MNKRIVLFLAVLTLSGCGQATAPLLSRPELTLSAKSVPQTKAQFIAAVSALGLRLSEAQLAEISANRSAKPNGNWAPRPAANLTDEQNLEVHFRKHGGEFKPRFENADAYLEGAMALAEGERGPIQHYFDITSFAKGYQSKIVIWNSSTRELTALRPDGAMTTFYHDTNLSPRRYVIVPVF